jgi:flavin-dependent dehydrogenase
MMSTVPTTTPDELWDVLVIGGGPAGSTVATLLRQKGRRVALLEKDRHPRFHIGESLLPMNIPILERLGLLERVRELGVVKYGAEFGSASAGRHQVSYFSNALDKTQPYAFHVCRAEFDDLLLKHSAAQGVNVQEGVRVTAVDFQPGQPTRVHAVTDDGQAQRWQARYVIDASGRDTVLARQFKLKQKNQSHQSAALFGHFAGVARNPGKDEGNISIYWFQHGWFWMIPLRDGLMSVGAVCWPEYLKTRHTPPEAFLWQTIALCPPVQKRMAQARLLGEAQATGNYSYRAQRMVGDGYLLLGDAFAFVDPVFSTGVYFAMHGATLAADAVDAHLRDPVQARPLLRRFERQIKHGIKVVSWFIYRFTSPAMQTLFMNPRNLWRLNEAMVSMLAGDLFRNTPIAPRLLLFKLIYGITLMIEGTRSWMSYRQRKRNVKLTFTGGTTAQDQF